MLNKESLKKRNITGDNINYTKAIHEDPDPSTKLLILSLLLKNIY